MCKDKTTTIRYERLLKRSLFICYLLLVNCYLLSAADFGVVLNQNGSVGSSSGDKPLFEYRAGIVPRFSALIGENSSFLMSASVTFNYNTEEEEFKIIPELLRTEFLARFGTLRINAGRITCADPTGHIANGLFDGLQLTHSSRLGRFGAGAWYTGLQYKKTANIIMTMDDEELFDKPFDYGDFAATYFAPRRLVASVDWDHPSVGEFMRLRAAVTAQFDLTGGNTKLNSQYFTLKAGIPAGGFLFEAGGILELMQSIDADTAATLALAGEAGIHWTMPVSFASRISLTANYFSGSVSEQLGAFTPVTIKYYGDIFQAKATALSVFSLGWSARFVQTLGANLSASYFLRNDLVTNSYSEKDEDSFLLGGELFGRLIWSPLSDWQFILGGGAFLPSLGDIWPDDEKEAKWRIALTVVLSL